MSSPSRCRSPRRFSASNDGLPSNARIRNAGGFAGVFFFLGTCAGRLETTECCNAPSGLNVGEHTQTQGCDCPLRGPLLPWAHMLHAFGVPWAFLLHVFSAPSVVMLLASGAPWAFLLHVFSAPSVVVLHAFGASWAVVLDAFGVCCARDLLRHATPAVGQSSLFSSRLRILPVGPRGRSLEMMTRRGTL